MLPLTGVSAAVGSARSSRLISTQPLLRCPHFEFWMGDRNSKMCQRRSDGDQSEPCDSTPKRGNAIPVGHGEFGGSKKKKEAGNPEGRIFVETVEMTSITRDLEHITCFASGR